MESKGRLFRAKGIHNVQDHLKCVGKTRDVSQPEYPVKPVQASHHQV